MKRTLINVPNLSFAGGVAALYKSLELEQSGIADYFCIHNIHKDTNKLQQIIRLVQKYIAFFFLIKSYDLVVINPSLDHKSFFRESIFAFIIHLRRKKLVVFWHGWDNAYEKKIKDSSFLRGIFSKSFARASGFVIVGNTFRNKLINLGIKEQSFFLRFLNIADDSFIKDFSIQSRLEVTSVFKVLYLSRIEKLKGIYIAIEAFSLLQKELPEKELELIIAGDGSELPAVCQLIKKNNVKNVIIKHFVAGLDKHEIFKAANLYLFPTYGEGLPLSVLEAMLYGLPVITRPVGGLPDLIQNDVNGYLVESLNPCDYVKPMKNFIENQNLYRSACLQNHQFALDNLIVEKAKLKLDSFLKSV